MAEDKTKPIDLTGGVMLGDLDATPLLAGKVGADEVLLVKGASGLFAVGAKCTHSGAPLAKGVIVGDTLRCPWHHACFDAPTGVATAAPAFRPLDRWTVEQRDGRVFVTAKQPKTEARTSSPQVGRIVIVGAGAAGAAAADALASLGAGASVTLIGNETEAPYDRTMLTKRYLAGKAGDDKLPLKMDDLAGRGVSVHLGATVTAIEPAAKLVHLADGTTFGYDRLILATGSEPKRLDVPGVELPHVVTLRTPEDARLILRLSATAGRVAIVGSSFIGLEAASALRDQNIAVTVVSPEEHPFAKTLGPDLSAAIMAVHHKHGTEFRLGRSVKRIEPDHVLLDDGSTLEADLVIVGIGVSPRLALAEQAGLSIDGGVVVDERLRTSNRDIFAIGDIARWPDPHSGRSIRVEHWDVAQRQGQVAALNALGGAHRYDVVPFFWTAHFDLSVRYVGHAGHEADPVLDGAIDRKDAAVRFTEHGRVTALATVGRDRESLETELAMERRLGAWAVALPAG